MKNKKGFTLIELLAVIVILAIIALIATPIILSLIEKVKIGAAKNSSYALIQSAKNYYTSSLMSDVPINGVETFTCDGSICISLEGNKLPITGTVPSSGSVAITGQGEIYFGLQYVDNEFIDDDIFFNQIMCVRNENQKINCSLEKISKKHNPGIICGNGEEEDYEGNDVCYVSTVEDMNELASMVNSGKSFEGKTVSVLKSINFNNANLDVIGSASNPFAGTFEGNGYTLSNIKIEGNNNTAMFGYNTGTIRGLNIENISVSGGSGTAGLVGKNDGVISMINLTGTITGTNEVGGISSSVSNNNAIIKDVIVNANITATANSSKASGLAHIAHKLKGINEGGQILGTASYGTCSGGLILSESSTMSIATDPARYSNPGQNSTQLSSDKYNNLNTYNEYLTTILDGADENGYYFDYNADGTDIIVKNIKTKPINTKLEGKGTAESPYLVYNANDLRKVALETDTTGKYYSLMNDINMSGQSYFIIGSASNPFAGIFDGNGYTISNIKIEGNNNTAMFSYNTGTIRGLNIDNINVIGGSGTAGLVGKNDGVISMINLTGTITGTNEVGGISSSVSNNNAMIKDVIVNANITATANSSKASGLAHIGRKLKGINEGGQISGTASYSTCSGGLIINESRTMSIATDPARYSSNYQNTELPSDKYNNLNTYNEYVTTILDGADENGYYFDYNADGTDIIVKNIKTKPINTKLEGKGTAESPYLVYNANDLRKVALETDTTGKYYSLMNNINMAGEGYYIIGSASNPFAGTFDGNGYTISNLNIEGNNNTAMFGYNKGIIRGFNIENITVTGGNNVAGVVGINDGGTVSMINLSGTITGTNTVCGISSGRNTRNNADVIKDVIVNANITATGANSVASGIASSSYVLKGINEGGQISGLSKAYASYEGEASRWNIKTMSIATNPARYLTSRDMNAQLSSDNYNNLTAYSTYITTSADEDGYYFDYNADGTDIIVKHV